MTTSFKHGRVTYLIVTTPSGLRDGELLAAKLEADPQLWASQRQKQAALGLKLENETEKPAYVRKNLAQRRRMSKLAMRRLRAERAA